MPAPPPADDHRHPLFRLVEIMARLRAPEGGCPWDVEQTFATIVPYTIEEAYEVADAIEGGDPVKLRDELGDLLFQVVFHAQMAQERGWFDFAQVASSIHDKLVRRHPHVFGGERVADEKELSRNWEEHKARERAASGDEVSVLADVPRGLPALVRAAKLGKRAGRVGFDWPDAHGVRDKVLEELREVDAAVAAADAAAGNAPAVIDPAVVEEMGDLLFALANWSRHMRFDAEEALRGANSKFERRFRVMESIARERGMRLDGLSAESWEALWQEAKKA